ncbi:hypothetical protein MNQ98_11805 [Paenibacillus sp. N3/727]|uniref:hypothetical protein n=1 Tax=Paenibacillus sp. N3/727 TaxID=2925845 RepID=UPI001F52DB4E|nr:hypothetical protein [Paenibacillus sp. N3/727]UNK20648.1 hypothetical protein MNQ98_11805 [Paenibacillus sp. N3/727]
MKKLFVMCMILSFVIGCGDETGGTQTQSIENKVDAAFAPSEAGKSSALTDDFSDISSSEWGEYIKVVREYLHLRTKAVLEKDINVLWKQFPQLALNMDQNTGINIEQQELDHLKSFNLLDANYNEESNDRIQVKKLGSNKAVVLVHTEITYLLDNYDISGGELIISLHVQRNHETDPWAVVKTDEYTLPEYKEWVKNKQSKS